MNVICEHCGSKEIVRKGKRKLLKTTNQVYLCKNCGSQFSSKQGKYDASLILSAVNAYNSGKSLGQTAGLVRRQYKIAIPRMTILRWAKSYGPDFLSIRKELRGKYRGIPSVSSKNFCHSGVIYPFMLHRWKLQEFCRCILLWQAPAHSARSLKTFMLLYHQLKR